MEPESKDSRHGGCAGEKRKGAIVQVALDFTSIDRALPIASEAVKGGVDWIEAGTPLIKAEGVEAIRKLRKAFPGSTIVADMKTMDTGALEVEMALKAGANIVTILASADDSTVEEGVRAAKKYNGSIMVDLIGVQDIVGRARRMKEIGVDYVCLHIGIDQQMRGVSPLEHLSELAQGVDIDIAVAGGITASTAATVIDKGAKVVIVGGAITKAKEVEKAAKEIVDAVKKGVVSAGEERHVRHTEETLHEAFMKVSTSNISDAMHRQGAMHGLKALFSKTRKFAGKAFTVRTMDGDWAKPVESIEKAPPGWVIVVDVNGGQTAVWGELASWSCKIKGIPGVVIDGAVRDVQDILAMDFPVYARHFVPNAGEPRGYGDTGGIITCGGRTVKYGDWIVADESGVVVVPQEKAVEIANRAIEVMESEDRIRKEIQGGKTLSVIMELSKWEIVR